MVSRPQDAPQQSAEAAVQNSMIQQAEAAAISEANATDMSATRRRHAGADVPLDNAISDDTDVPTNDVPPPAYGEQYGEIRGEKDGLGTSAIVTDDGRVDIRIRPLNRRLSQIMIPALRQQEKIDEDERVPPPPYIPPSLGGQEGVPPPPPMNVVIQVVGSRGDVQPFVALGKILKDTYGHRVRLATHPNFNDFVSENGLEFFNIGGDPTELMAFMVKNPGLMPGFDSLRSGDIGRRRKEVGEYLKGCWRSCYEAGNGLGVQATDKSVSELMRSSNDADNQVKPFVADCIIANPPSFAHIHCAEKLGIPLHVMFTMPYSPTQAFPHPLANIQSSNTDPQIANYMSYPLIDMLTWQGLGDVINRFREKSLGLDPISLIWAPGMLQRLKVPHTYCWSPALIPKPKDWGAHISISGFFFLNLASNYTPAPELQAFLDAGPPPVYIGFGSIVLDDPTAMTELIFEAVRKTGQRVLLSKGWGGMGADELGIPESVFMLGNVPHDWLFKHVSCVVHHGGAGTTAAGITAGRPTVVVPFFGDQPFWGSMIARAGAGPEPIPHKQLTADNLADAINMCLKPESQGKAKELAAKIAKETGSDSGAQSFHQYLEVDRLRCSLAPSRTAVWRIKRTQVRLSAFAACTLANAGLLDFHDLKLFRSQEYETDQGPWDPISGGASALVGTLSTMFLGIADFPIQTLKTLQIHPDVAKQKKEAKEQKEREKQAAQEQERAEGEPSSSGASIRSNDTTRAGSTANTNSLTTVPSTATSQKSGASTPVTSPGQSQSSFNLQESLARVNTPPNLSKSKSKDSEKRPSFMAGRDYDGLVETTVGTSKGIGRIVKSGLEAPVDFTMSLAKGFHNAPRLYGDDTVRKQSKVTGIRSGVIAAGKEFGLGFYDGVGGLVTQPVRGAKKEGVAGFVKGVGKGIGGVALKPGAAIWGLPAYLMKGVHKEVQGLFGSSVQNYIIASRTAEGYDDWIKSSDEEKHDVVRRWKHIQKDIKKKRNADEMVRDILEEQRKKKAESRRTRQDSRPDPDQAMMAMGSPPIQRPQEALEEEQVQQAIRQSVQETSRGDVEEDANVERAIQRNVSQLQRQRQAADHHHTDEQNLRDAVAASEADAQRQKREEAEYEEQLRQVLAQSLKEQRRQRSSDSEWEDSDIEADVDTEDDENFARARKVTENLAGPPAYEGGDGGHVGGTTAAEYQRQQGEPQGPGKGEKTSQERSEEEIVMEYVKKQSMLEEEHNSRKGKGKAAEENDEEDEELQRALKLSMQGHSGGQAGEASGS